MLLPEAAHATETADKHWPNRPLGSRADSTLYMYLLSTCTWMNHVKFLLVLG